MFDPVSSDSVVQEGETATACIIVNSTASAITNDLSIQLSTIPDTAGISHLDLSISQPLCIYDCTPDADDYVSGGYYIVFNSGTPFPLIDCVNIPTTADDVLEGDQNFTVEVLYIVPQMVHVLPPSTLLITIDDNDGTCNTCLVVKWYDYCAISLQE